MTQLYTYGRTGVHMSSTNRQSLISVPTQALLTTTQPSIQLSFPVRTLLSNYPDKTPCSSSVVFSDRCETHQSQTATPNGRRLHGMEYATRQVTTFRVTNGISGLRFASISHPLKGCRTAQPPPRSVDLMSMPVDQAASRHAPSDMYL